MRKWKRSIKIEKNRLDNKNAPIYEGEKKKLKQDAEVPAEKSKIELTQTASSHLDWRGGTAYQRQEEHDFGML